MDLFLIGDACGGLLPLVKVILSTFKISSIGLLIT